MESLSELKELIRLMKREGVTHYKAANGFELSLGAHAFERRKRRRLSKAEGQDQQDDQSLQRSEEEILFWSSPGFPPTEGITE